MFVYLAGKRSMVTGQPAVSSYRTGGAGRKEKIGNPSHAYDRCACKKGSVMTALRILALSLVMLTAMLAGCATERTSRNDGQPSLTPARELERSPAGMR
jgi:hypothetical protein